MPVKVFPETRVAWLLSFLFALGCTPATEEAIPLAGNTMGTTWYASVVPPTNIEAEQLVSLLQAALDQVDASMSTYRDDSDLGRFNAAQIGECIAISEDTLNVTQIALKVAEQSHNAFNPAVASLTNLWGFGPAAATATARPSTAAIEAAMKSTDLNHLELSIPDSRLCKRGPVQLDYSAIAKGYGTDRAAEVLEEAGINNYMVEVGGEVRTAGHHPAGRAWRIGIERPQLTRGAAIAAISLVNEAVATSGDYRNYREMDGVRYSHTIDPASGVPIAHALASVTVVAPTAVLADAYATAINVMGPEEGLGFAESMSLPVYLLLKDGEGFEARFSSAFEPYLQ